MDASGAFHQISIDGCKLDGSVIGAVLNGNELGFTGNQLTANQNVDVLLQAVSNSNIVGNTCDSTLFANGSARNSIYETGACSNNRISGNFIRAPILQGGTGSEYTDYRTIV